MSPALGPGAMLSLLAAAGMAAAQDTDYVANAQSAYSALQNWYDSSTGLWNTCGWWNGANCMTAIADLAVVDGSMLSDAESVFATTYANAPAQNPSSNVVKQSVPGMVRTWYGLPEGASNSSRSSSSSNDDLKKRDVNAAGWLDSCYDDNGWWALAWIAAYDLTGNSDYLGTAEGIFGNMSAAWPSPCGGGILWCATETYVNAIANELFLSVAAHLANRVDSGDAATYVDWAQKEWSWFQSVDLINADGVIVDGLTSDCVGDTSATVWSYNQGVVLGGLVELAKADASNAASYLSAANSIATAAIHNLTDSNNILHDVCEPDCAPDGTQFKGIFMRNLAKLQGASSNDLYKTVINANAQSIWDNDRLDSNNSLSIDWAGPYVSWANASTQSSALEGLIAAAAIA